MFYLRLPLLLFFDVSLAAPTIAKIMIANGAKIIKQIIFKILQILETRKV